MLFREQIIELTKLGIDVGYNAINRSELTDNDIKSFPPEVQEALKKGLRQDSINIFFSYPDIYPQVRCAVNVGYTGADSSGWYQTNGAILPSESCNQYMDYMLTPSDYSRQIMKNCGVDIPIELFPHGIDPDLLHARVKPKDKEVFTYCYVGELSRRKGSIDLIEAFIDISKIVPDAKLILRANTHMQYYDGQVIHELCKDQKNIQLIWDDKGQGDVSKFYNSSDCYVYPSRADWFGMTVFEALAVGMPVVATATNGYYEFLKDHMIHLYYTEEDIGNEHPYLKGKWNKVNLDKLASALQVVTEKEIYRPLADYNYRSALEFTQNYSWENVTKQYLVPFLEKIEEKHFKSERKFKKIICGYP